MIIKAGEIKKSRVRSGSAFFSFNFPFLTIYALIVTSRRGEVIKSAGRDCQKKGKLLDSSIN